MSLLSKYWKPFASLAFGLAVFLFWWLAYPMMTAYQEQYQLFMLDSQYIGQLLSVPDGLAHCIGEYLVQLYINHALGALVLAVVFVLMQWLVWLLMKAVRGAEAATHYALSFLPSLLLCLMMADESVLLTFPIAMLAGLAAMWLYELIVDGKSLLYLIIYVIVGLPLLYWMAGPVVLMTAAYIAIRQLMAGHNRGRDLAVGLLAVVLAIGCILMSSWWVPYPLERLFQGLDYYRFVEVYFYFFAVLMVVCVLLPVLARWLPVPLGSRQKQWAGMGEAVVLAGLFMLLRPMFYDARKYEVMEYDYMVRCNNWSAIIAKAEKKTPDLPMSVCANNLALGMKGLLGERAFDFYQNGMQGLLPGFERNFSTIMLTGEVYWQLGLVNTSQRYAFEAMEAIPNYAKSCRAVKRLAESNLVNGQYKVARKYLLMLEKTLSYSKWARRTMLLLGDEKAINAHPVYGRLRQLRLDDDFLFSEQELDKVMGQLVMKNIKNGLALQYLLLSPLLERDVNKFMNYMTFVDGLKIGYCPRSCQEAIVFAFAQRNQQPPAGYINQLVLSNFADFARTASAGANAAGLERFRNTTWYYLTVGR
ncbi:MAG: hypothetical protein II404_06750 [Prevotella sp.]|nr:hypothetical protein [Prevotella sp.]